MAEHPDIWRSADNLLKEHGSNAATQAAMRASTFEAKGDAKGMMVWKRTLGAVEELLRQQSRHDEPPN
jgi:hypothetical protein